MASLEVLALDPAVPQIRSPKSGDTYNMARRVNFAEGVIPRVDSTASAAGTLSWNSTDSDIVEVTAQAEALAITFDSGSPVNGQKIIFRLKDNGTSRALSWETAQPKGFRAIGVTLPAATIATKTLYIGAIYNSAAQRWDVIGLGQET
jgi:hypothetical protein